MIMADSFCQNAKARASEFSTTVNDSPLIVQFAANTTGDFLDASKLVYPYADGIDLNCGCPQKWAMKDGYGCALLSNTQTIYDLMKGIRNCLPNDFTVSVKIRILKELKRSIEMCQQLEKCGVSFITVHGRTPQQKSSEDIDIDALHQVCQSIKIPIVANGGVKTLLDADNLYGTLKCNGVMAASALLTNPALFSGANVTPLSCIKLWMLMKDKDPNISFQCYHHHLVFMLEKVLTKQQKNIFNHLSSFEAVDDYLISNILNCYTSPIEFEYNLDEFISCEYADEITLKHVSKCRRCGKSIHYCLCMKYDCNNTEGKYFSSYVNDIALCDYTGFDIFDETG
ncbi:tRNA-dihydrouridine(20a/20b) synthase [NAD(P)+]-like isoform X2 [Achroia grisella]|nr:tRNA-dihydrouridine(20a/20b) synthase [NAD(P)+]-like isoform X2 [Achroia grisella]XP_059059790.1 tRNA-dihydrouridine(20a/20b) synthase [NAD(P)+]-like isoform X2 [Achroia grisella]